MSKATTQLPVVLWRQAVRQSDLSPTARHVALTLACSMKNITLYARPGAARLAKETGLHKTTVLRALGELVEAGFLDLIKKGSAKPGMPRAASEYVGRLVADDDRSQTMTGHSVLSDRSLSATGPVAQSDPNSVLNSGRTLEEFDVLLKPPEWVRPDPEIARTQFASLRKTLKRTP